MSTQAVAERESVVVVATTRRTLWKTDCGHLSDLYDDNEPCRCGAIQNRVRASWQKANLVSSLCDNGLHAPALDIDFPVTLEAREGGRFLLKMDKAMTKDVNYRLLDVLHRLGISSVCHTAGILIDCSAKLFPSSTHGHFHLYLDICLSWNDYADLLGALDEARIIERRYYKIAMDRKQTYLRPPGVLKAAETY